MSEELKPCPFCGGKAIWRKDSGSYGYTPPKIWIACENEPFENPYGKGYDTRKNKCFAKTKAVATEEWTKIKGTYSIDARARTEVIAAWNTRTDSDRIEALNAEVARLREDRDAALDALFDAIALIGHAMPMETTALIGGERMIAKNVWQKGHDIMFPRARAALGEEA